MKDKRTAFFELYSKHQSTIYGFIVSHVPNYADVDDIYQETSIELWEKFDEFEEGTNFLAWARAFARISILRYRQTKGRSRLQFSDDVEELLEQTFTEKSDHFEFREQALKHCLQKLTDDEQLLFKLCYNEKMNIRKAAEYLNRNAKGLYKTMSKLRKLLLNCIREQEVCS